MQEIDIETVKKLELDMLIDFAKFCDKNNYTYWLGGGTLLGAIRHKGFIPWDDDIDIMMPREDYEQAVRNYRHQRYKMDSILLDNNSIVPYARLCDMDTIISRESVKRKYKQTVFIDIAPIEGLPEKKWQQWLTYTVAWFLISCRTAAVTTYTTSKKHLDRYAGVFNWRHYVRTLLKYVFITLLGWTKPGYWNQKIDRLAKKHPFSQAMIVGCLTTGVNGVKEIMPREIFANKILVDFEGYKFWGLKEYDFYLSCLYGEYQQLPPPSKRIAHHDFKAFYIGRMVKK